MQRRWPSRGQPANPGPEEIAAAAAGAVAPVITSLVTDQPSYAKGAEVTITGDYTDGTSLVTVVATLTVTDSTTGLSTTKSVSYGVNEPDPTSATGMTDANGRTYAKSSDANGVAVFTTTA